MAQLELRRRVAQQKADDAPHRLILASAVDYGIISMRPAWPRHELERGSASIRLYDAYLPRMGPALEQRQWLVADAFSMADIGLAPYLNRLSALAIDGMWTGGRLPGMEASFERARERPSFHPAFVEWMPQDLAEEMHANGRRAWPDVKALLSI